MKHYRLPGQHRLHKISRHIDIQLMPICRYLPCAGTSMLLNPKRWTYAGFQWSNWNKRGQFYEVVHGPLTRYIKLRVAHAPGMPGTFSPPSTSEEAASKRSRHASRHVRDARVVMHLGIANPQWRGKPSRHSRRMRNPQFPVSGKRPMLITNSYRMLAFVMFESKTDNRHHRCYPEGMSMHMGLDKHAMQLRLYTYIFSDDKCIYSYHRGVFDINEIYMWLFDSFQSWLQIPWWPCKAFRNQV